MRNFRKKGNILLSITLFQTSYCLWAYVEVW